MLSHFSRVWLFAALWTIAHQAPPSFGFSWQEYWRGWPCSPPGDLPDPGVVPTSLMSPALASGFFPSPWLCLMTEVLFGLLLLFPLFLHILTSLSKLILWLKFFHRQKAGRGRGCARTHRVLLHFRCRLCSSLVLSYTQPYSGGFFTAILVSNAFEHLMESCGLSLEKCSCLLRVCMWYIEGHWVPTISALYYLAVSRYHQNQFAFSFPLTQPSLFKENFKVNALSLAEAENSAWISMTRRCRTVNTADVRRCC